jgi:hypothetical protein
MDNTLIGIPLAITAIIPNNYTMYMPIKAERRIDDRTLTRDEFLAYAIPIKINPEIDLLKKLSTISNLEENWDGYNGAAFDFSVIHNSLAFLKNLPENVISDIKTDDLTPTPYGTLVFDFNNNDDLVSVEIGENQIGFYTDFRTSDNFNLDRKSFNQDALPFELIDAFKKLYKANLVSRNSIQD